METLLVSSTKNTTLKAILAIVLLSILCYVWYGLVMKKFYSNYTDSGVSTVNMIIGVITVLIVLAFALSVLSPSSSGYAALYGAIIGLVVFAFCNGIILATNKTWSAGVLLTDTTWGIALSSFVMYILYLANKSFS
ncbi:MAG: DUF2177 family protein [Colwellia sp.]|nr:DUF2177 family protein [Colwellia sp.]